MVRAKTNGMRTFFFTFAIYITFCSCKSNTQVVKDPKKQELATIDSLLRDSAFAQSMANTLDSSYYASLGQTPPEFLSANDDTAMVIKRKKDEKVATNLAGFYALECGIGLLCAQTNARPVEWLQKIINGSADTTSIMLLNRFANATWKASQPFRGLNRITRPNFIVFSSLSPDEIDKDYVQIKNAAVKLLSSLKTVSDSSLPKQMEVLGSLLQDTVYAVEMASFLDSSFYVSQHQTPSPFSTADDDTATIKKNVKETKIATSIAGFYALECGVNYLATTKNRLPSAILKSVANNSMNPEEKMIFARFANATWKAGQPFRGLNRITRATFTPFYFLTEQDIEKDMVQIRAAAQRLLSLL
ncbi:MAG: hypothetical protein H0V14_09885 [Chitinophagaceae bacterium]|nr:hypothetical protein [Chitinophagaceae bacterium]